MQKQLSQHNFRQKHRETSLKERSTPISWAEWLNNVPETPSSSVTQTAQFSEAKKITKWKNEEAIPEKPPSKVIISKGTIKKEMESPKKEDTVKLQSRKGKTPSKIEKTIFFDSGTGERDENVQYL